MLCLNICKILKINILLKYLRSIFIPYNLKSSKCIKLLEDFFKIKMKKIYSIHQKSDRTAFLIENITAS